VGGKQEHQPCHFRYNKDGGYSSLFVFWRTSSFFYHTTQVLILISNRLLFLGIVSFSFFLAVLFPNFSSPGLTRYFSESYITFFSLSYHQFFWDSVFIRLGFGFFSLPRQPYQLCVPIYKLIEGIKERDIKSTQESSRGIKINSLSTTPKSNDFDIVESSFALSLHFIFPSPQSITNLDDKSRKDVRLDIASNPPGRFRCRRRASLAADQMGRCRCCWRRQRHIRVL